MLTDSLLWVRCQRLISSMYGIFCEDKIFDLKHLETHHELLLSYLTCNILRFGLFKNSSLVLLTYLVSWSVRIPVLSLLSPGFS